MKLEPKEFRKTHIKVPLEDVALMMMYLLDAAKDPKIGNEHTTLTIDELIHRLSRYSSVWISKNRAEDALWAAGMLEEQGKWWHPYYKTMRGWANKWLGVYKTYESTNFQILRKGKKA